MKAKFTLLILMFIFIFVIGTIPKISQDKKTIFPSEKIFYKRSDVGTDVFKLTSDLGNDHIFYQEPNYFNTDSSIFLFKSDRGDGKERLYLSNLNSGEITPLRKSDSFGHVPTWSIDSNEVYIGEHGKIIEINIKTLKEKIIKITEKSWVTFLHVNSAGDRLLFVEEGAKNHKSLSVIKTDGSDYKKLVSTDDKTVFYIDHPIFIDNNQVLFLTRGKNRDFTGDYNKPHIKDINGDQKRLPVQCSHYDVNPKGDKILCGSEGYIIDLNGNILKAFPEIRGHGVWAPDGDTFLMTADPVPVPRGPYFGKIVILKFSSDERYNLVSHESTYNSSIATHIQPNAQFSRDGKYIIYESEKGQSKNSDLYLVKVLE